MKRALALMLSVVLAPFAVPTAAAATVSNDAVITWNENAQTAIWDVARENPWVQSRSFAMVQGAVYDAVNAIAGKPYQPYLSAPRTTGRESTDAAVAAAAHRVLAALFPAQQERLQAQYDAYLAGIPDGRAEQSGIAVGERTADAMLAARSGDGAFGVEAFPVGDQPGQWRPTPPTFANAGAWSADLRPFVLPRADLFRTAGPPSLTSAAYTRDFTEIKAIGAVDSTTRTADQTDAARWWHDRRLGQWEINRQLAVSRRLSALQTARLLAMVNIAASDANTACFNEKRHWGFWRPVTAVQLAETDGNPATTGDASWMPLLITPGSPDYTSGHACATGSNMTILRLFFGRDDIPFHATSADTGTTRYFTSFSGALEELINARVWGGIHFRSADDAGAGVGARTSVYLYLHAFRRR
ncbi:haloperoxidase [Actinoplanes philippinensis]|uniref:PAP2 superfamily protein n=1 Tax=Actinoplanes philippinensis TaxID=35752 RepID=A0A1I2CHZ7_9ACTN|nr:vanadium-dependent haloperoxidase [Actinoplanes philippinensis]GIE74863.1 haloperoxidase [Actinoplanes philippinensis]SFE67999.1 PAP2 superfamily protein [Actinoplanes philippinensis]